jgi:hypothetical protein
MKRILAIAAVALMLATLLLAGGCTSGKMNMLMGRWKLETAGDGSGANQQQYPLPVVIDIFPNGTIDMLEMPFGKWTMDRDTFTFKSDDGTIDMAGGFKLEFIANQETGGTTPTLTVFPDTADVSYVLKKTADLGPLESLKRANAAASAAAVQTPAPTASAAEK